MVYKFDPMYWNGTIFSLDETWEMGSGWMEYERKNQPVPASYFPKSLTFDGARGTLPDIFHTARDIIVFSERARVVMEEWAPGQVEFIPVACHAERGIAARLNFDSAYYFINARSRPAAAMARNANPQVSSTRRWDGGLRVAAGL